MSAPNGSPFRPLAPLGVEGEAQLLSLLGADSDPLEAVLDFLLHQLSAHFVLLVQGEPPAPQLAIGRRPPGRPIARPERLVRAGDLRDGPRGRLLFEPCAPGPGGRWRLACPIPWAGQPRPWLFAEGPAPLSAPAETGLPAWIERMACWVAAAHRAAAWRRGAGPSALPGPAPGEERLSAVLDDRSPFEEFPEIVAQGSAMQEVLRTVSLVAASQAAVLIEGESGTGKELIARAIHRKSQRSGGPFITENCAACPEGLLEAEFFGVERGAFTGAHATKRGLFERANRGTLFLDEIGEMDLALQRKLLRVLQEREVRRVGGSAALPVDFRLITATNRFLSDEARTGRFRPDLLYRIEVVTIRLPPLRERREDIPLLLDHFLAFHARAAGRPPPPVDAEALHYLCAYSWPGNVRELSNEAGRAVALRVPALTPRSLSPKILRPEGGGAFARLLRPGRRLEEIERDFLGGVIREALRQTDGNKILAAQLLGIPKTSLYRRLRRYAITEFDRPHLPSARGGRRGGDAPVSGGGGGQCWADGRPA